MPRSSPEAIVFGVCLIALGVIGTLANLGLLELLPTLRRAWPLSLILWGALELRRAAAAGAARRSA
jgi:hypothetical protein